MTVPDRRPRRILAVALAVAVGGSGLAACGDDEPAADAQVGGPVTVRSCGTPLRFDAVPRRAVVRDTALAEILLSLGLDDRVVGYSNYRPRKLRTPLPEFAARIDAWRFLGAGTLTREQLLSVKPDFLFAGYNYGLDRTTGVVPERLAKDGIATYVFSETCRVVDRSLAPPTQATVHGDITAIGRIFRVEDRAARLVDALRARTAAVERRLAGVQRRPVFVYMSGEDAPFTGGRGSVLSDLLQRAGGTNVAAKAAGVWTAASWETVVRARPELIVIGDYGEEHPTPQEKLRVLERLKILRDVPAIRHRRFLVLPAEALNPGVRNAWGIESIAHALHPDRVGRPGPVLPPEAARR